MKAKGAWIQVIKSDGRRFVFFVSSLNIDETHSSIFHNFTTFWFLILIDSSHIFFPHIPAWTENRIMLVYPCPKFSRYYLTYLGNLMSAELTDWVQMMNRNSYATRNRQMDCSHYDKTRLYYIWARKFAFWFKSHINSTNPFLNKATLSRGIVSQNVASWTIKLETKQCSRECDD